MRDSHQHLLLTAAEWEAFLDDFPHTLDKFKVPQAEQEELKAIVDNARRKLWSESRIRLKIAQAGG